MSLSSLLPLCAVLVARMAAASAYIGCFSPEALEGGGGVIYDNTTDSCPALVAEGGLPYSNSWPVFGDESNFHACRGWNVPFGNEYLVADRFCGFPNVNVTLVDPPTQWTGAGCWFLYPTDAWTPVANFSDCLASCRAYPYAYGRYDDNTTISCLCSASQPPVDLPLDCGYGDAFWYTHPALPSGFAKRQMKERMKRDQQLAMGLCPKGRTACKVPSSDGGGFECIDTEYELESCGGCIHGELADGSQTGSLGSYGVDCSAVPGIAPGGVTCTRGECLAFA
ncbi:hypothetical protein IAU59_005616 [Kwoniella sp. CBS 9459]